jgi:gamma-glutamyltranspeptidase/glutathione hydrolase
MPNKRFHVILSIIVTIGLVGAFFYQKYTYQDQSAAFEKTIQKKGTKKYGVAAGHPEAVRIGMEVLEQGGNAVDAAIAVSYALGVVELYGSGIGGGGTMLVYPSNKKHKPAILDYREHAPFTGEIPENSVGIPGFVKGMEMAHKKYGKLPLKQLIQPSIDLAEKGFEVSSQLTYRLQGAQARMPVAQIPHLYPGGRPIAPKQLLQQKQLAETLKLIRDGGAQAFYSGALAKKIEQQTKGVKLTDLQKYQPTEKEPFVHKYKDYKIYTPGPPSGGIMLFQSLRMTEDLKIHTVKDMSADFIHLMGEVNKRANSSRIKYLGDPNFVNVPVKDMTTDGYIQRLSSSINRTQISEKYKVETDTIADKEDHDNTTHLVVVDQEGTVVSATNTLSNFFGSGIYVDGLFLNNQLANFSTNK